MLQLWWEADHDKRIEIQGEENGSQIPSALHHCSFSPLSGKLASSQIFVVTHNAQWLRFEVSENTVV
jgi:hypothetical protein